MVAVAVSAPEQITPHLLRSFRSVSFPVHFAKVPRKTFCAVLFPPPRVCAKTKSFHEREQQQLARK